MKDLLEYILEGILGKDSGITIDENDDNGFITYTVTSPQEHMGKIIGKGGKTINSIKNILKIRAIKEGKKIDIQVQEQSA